MTRVDLSAMSLREMADAVAGDRLTYEQVQLEWAARRRAGLDPVTGKPPEPAPDRSEPLIAATPCPNCGALQRAANAPESVSR